MVAAEILCRISQSNDTQELSRRNVTHPYTDQTVEEDGYKSSIESSFSDNGTRAMKNLERYQALRAGGNGKRDPSDRSSPEGDQAATKRRALAPNPRLSRENRLNLARNFGTHHLPAGGRR
jgi:hypothetical protein